MKSYIQNNLFNHIISNTEIDEIQCRYIAYKLELNQLEKITLIENIEEHKFTFFTDNGSFKVTKVNLTLPISLVVREFIIFEKSYYEEISKKYDNFSLFNLIFKLFSYKC